MTAKFLAYETKLSELNTELTEVKVELMKNQERVAELTALLHENKIPLPEEKIVIQEKKEEREKQKKVIVSVSAHTLGGGGEGGDDEGRHAEVDGPGRAGHQESHHRNQQLLLHEPGGAGSLRPAHGDEGCKLLADVFSQGWSLVNILQFYFSPPTLPRLHSIILYGNDIGKQGAAALLNAFRYLPQVELLGLEVLRGPGERV